MINLSKSIFNRMNEGYLQFKAIIESALDPNFIVDLEHIRTWTSMQSLIVVSAIDEHYDVLVSHEDLVAVDTLPELYGFVRQKLS